MFENLDKKQKIIFFSIIAAMILFIIFYIYNNLSSTSDYQYNDSFEILNSSIDSNLTDTLEESSHEKLVTVYICGAVKESKVVSLSEGSRIIDAIDSVGGFSEKADRTVVNLAALLEDGEKIYIPTIEENSSEDFFSNSLQNKKVNINTATQDDFESLQGIGPSTALKIIDYRKTNGKFNSIEDLKDVPGIGDAKFENIKDDICVK